GDKKGIRNLPKSSLIKGACVDYILKKDAIQNQYKFVISSSEMLSHNRWVEREIDRMQVAKNLTDTLLHEIKRHALSKVSQGSENVFVDIMTRLIETSLDQMPVDLNIDITRNDRQSASSKNRKARQVVGSRGNKPDLMVRVYFKRRWNVIIIIG
ncbi:22816_t:CDS:1, partial [Gigaspora rosea]